MRFTNYTPFCADLEKHGIEYAAAHSAELGFEAVEFLDLCPIEQPLPSRIQAEQVVQALRANGLSVACYSLCADLSVPDREALLKELFLHVDFAAAIGSPFFHHTVVCGLELPPNAPTYDEMLALVLPVVTAVARRCAEYGMTCLYEPQGMYFNGVDGLGRLFAEVKKTCPNVGICGDVGNSLFADTPATDIYDAFIDHMVHVHVKDYQVGQGEEGETTDLYSRSGIPIYDRDIGRGVTDFEYCFAKLKAAGYDGDIAFEITGDDQTVRDAMQFVRDLWNR